MKIYLNNLCFLLFVNVLLFSCQAEKEKITKAKTKVEKLSAQTVTYQTTTSEIKYSWLQNFDSKTSLVNQIQPPSGFNRVITTSSSFERWLQFLPLFPKEKKVELYDGSMKGYQGGKARVINIDIGKRDLQQCADAVMRLRAEYLFGKKDFEKIHFNYTNGTNVSFDDWRKGKKPVVKGNKVSFSSNGKKDDSYANFKKYLIQIFNYAGTASLEKEMKAVPISEMQIGDVLIQGGHPGHAILVIDMAENKAGRKIYLLAQSYMPAQNIHILNNFMNTDLSPWYELLPNKNIATPEWEFTPGDLKRFEE